MIWSPLLSEPLKPLIFVNNNSKFIPSPILGSTGCMLNLRMYPCITTLSTYLVFSCARLLNYAELSCVKRCFFSSRHSNFHTMVAWISCPGLWQLRVSVLGSIGSFWTVLYWSFLNCGTNAVLFSQLDVFSVDVVDSRPRYGGAPSAGEDKKTGLK